MKKVKNDEIQYHIGLSKDMIKNAEYAVLINDIKYVESIANIIDKNAIFLAKNREYYTYLAKLNNRSVIVVSTGLGGPPMGIGIEELATIGIKYFIRLGETGGLQYNMNVGDLVLSKAAVRMDGTSYHYAPEGYPAAASLGMTNTFDEVLSHNKLTYHFGVTVTTDSFWPAQGRTNGYMEYVPSKYNNIVDEWRKNRILSVDMELATLFTMCNVFDLEAVGILDVVNRNFESDEIKESSDLGRVNTWNKFLKNAIDTDMHRRGLI
jgi:uridine phosphorylase